MLARSMTKVPQDECDACAFAFDDHSWPAYNCPGFMGMVLICIKDLKALYPREAWGTNRGMWGGAR